MAVFSQVIVVLGCLISSVCARCTEGLCVLRENWGVIVGDCAGLVCFVGGCWGVEMDARVGLV